MACAGSDHARRLSHLRAAGKTPKGWGIEVGEPQEPLPRPAPLSQTTRQLLGE
jgi:hypothetical protein